MTQSRATDWQDAKEALIGSDGFRQFTETMMPSTLGAPITADEVFLMIPMTCLKNCWVMQGGRAGEYFTVIVVRTDDTGEVEDLSDG